MIINKTHIVWAVLSYGEHIDCMDKEQEFFHEVRLNEEGPNQTGRNGEEDTCYFTVFAKDQVMIFINLVTGLNLWLPVKGNRELLDYLGYSL